MPGAGAIQLCASEKKNGLQDGGGGEGRNAIHILEVTTHEAYKTNITKRLAADDLARPGAPTYMPKFRTRVSVFLSLRFQPEVGFRFGF